ncbi:hypothetical protein [Halorhabdus amylolytica]|uniref:hypothetical protein n=1 Tax=Halorhabdus amylolytica TaxID=2559573 RepID=UPI0010AAF3B8|nr:hypothetical protein [Halorhabdus amylolytica]
MEDSYHKIVDSRRYRGVLTSGDVEFINDPINKEKGRRDAKYRIRERITNSIRDLEYLHYQLPRRQKRRLGNKLHDDLSNVDRVLNSAIALLYSIHAGEEHPVEDSILGENIIPFEDRTTRMVANSLALLELAKGKRPDINIKIDINSTEPDPQQVINRVLSGDGKWIDIHYLSRRNSLVPLLDKIIESEKSVIITSDYRNDRELRIDSDYAKEMKKKARRFE